MILVPVIDMDKHIPHFKRGKGQFLPFQKALEGSECKPKLELGNGWYQQVIPPQTTALTI